MEGPGGVDAYSWLALGSAPPPLGRCVAAVVPPVLAARRRAHPAEVDHHPGSVRPSGVWAQRESRNLVQTLSRQRNRCVEGRAFGEPRGLAELPTGSVTLAA